MSKGNTLDDLFLKTLKDINLPRRRSSGFY